jgi:hypothetical protein
MKRTILAVCSDTHGGHRYGLLSPETLVDDIDEKGNKIGNHHPELNRIQKYLWGMYESQIKAIGEYAKGDDIVVVLNGDLTAGIKHPQMLVSDRIADQFAIGFANVMPWYGIKPRAVCLIKGTEAHNFNQGSSELVIAKLLQATFPDISTKVSDHSLISTAGIDVDVSHHGPFTGSRMWLKGNVARYYLQSAMLDEIAAGKTPPRLYLRAHYHEEIEETVIVKANGNRYKSTIVITPSFAFIDDHARQSARSPSRITHGMVMTEVVDGDILRTVPLTKTIDIRTREEL